MHVLVGEAAQVYAERYGWPVFPLREGSKEPATPNGWKDATTDPVRIAKWWADNPGYNLGIATGPAGLAVIDFDAHADDYGNEAHELVTRLPGTLTSRTANGGAHYVYRGGLRSTVRKLCPGVDTRGEGGYIVAPPSVVGGVKYEWVDHREPEPLPEWLNLDQPEKVKAAEVTQKSSTTPYGRAALNSEAAHLLNVPAGSRNASLFASACNVYGLVKGGHIDRQEATSTIVAATAGWAHHDDPFTASEVRKVLESAWERAEPRDVASMDQPETSNLVSARRWLTFDDLGNIPPPRWLIPNMLPEGVSMIFGKAGGGKTFAAVDAALSIAATMGPVAYCVGEGVTGFHSRVESWLLAHPDQRAAADNLLVLANGAFPRLATERGGNQFLEDIRLLAEEHGDPELVVLDTWRRVVAPSTVNDDAVVAQAFMILDRLRARHGSNVLILHHPRKESSGDPRPPEAGSGSLNDNLDCTWELYRQPEHDIGTLVNRKMKEFELQPNLSFALKPVANSLIVSPSLSEGNRRV